MDKLGNKNFSEWMRVKKRIDKENKIRTIKEGDVWWSSVGENVGNEICGKGNEYVRPVLVFRKLNRTTFWAIPLTSKMHKGTWYAHFEFNHKTQVAVVSQIRNMSVARLKRKVGQLSKGDYEKIFSAFEGLVYTKRTKPPKTFIGRIKYALAKLTRGGRVKSRICIH